MKSQCNTVMFRGRSSSPSEGGFKDDDVAVDFGAVLKQVNVGGVDSDGVDQSAEPDPVTCCRRERAGQVI